ncbi:putative uncharacterized protein DDB_G0286901 [Metopolophium dirhodum]|uniref:putative uncharacterized protein DDB_G0286901 n=1 Tax=Metopolophium dirhodum TaxID=44670 RepID=UPI00298FAC83|nr:putative uncharacterized protein DDB_G0286901 [Metopolophium dirhodum]
MFFPFVLASALTLSAVLGGPSGPTLRQMTYAKEHKTIMQSDETAQVMAVGDRSSNLKYVMAIQSSKIWEEIKKRSLTINTSQGLDDEVAGKSPDDLTDEELARLKQACHDGLKCVAVDQLLVLKQVKEQLGDGKMSVRMVITKITQVLTQYTTEYHEDVYQYEAVQQSDDQSKVYESVTTIVEDNKELCQIDLTPETVQSHPNNSDGNTIPATVNNNSTVNYNTIENYNINNGTVNSATINKEPSDIITVEESPEPGTQGNGSDSSLVIVIAPETETADGDGYTKKRSVDDRLPTERTTITTGTDNDGLPVPINDVSQKRVRKNHTRGIGTSDQHYEPDTTTDDQQLMITDGPSPHGGVGNDNGSRGQKARRPWPKLTRGRTNDDDKKNVSAHRSADTNSNIHDHGHSDHVENNNVSLKNGVENGQAGKSDCDHDIVSAGSSNNGAVRKGYVEDGTLNNGNMVQYNVNNGTINKGEISGSNADNGIISVGTVNNGPVNYGTSDTYANNGKQVAMNSNDVQQYLSNIDKMYSTILERLG